MAKNHNSAASAVGERRLRPIYDWLDHGNNKRAWQEAEKVLKKQPDFPCGRALLALALVRLGRDVEAQRVLRDLAHTGPTEDATLQAMTIAYRELESVADICRMYEIATQKEPNNEDLLSHLFMSYVRVSDYKKQQRTALQLFKVQPKNPYYFWAVMSVVLQASADPQGTTAQTLMFPLAERMIKKMHEENKLNREQETHLFLLVLELQDKYAEALEILESPLGKALNESTSYLHFFNFKKLEYLKALKRWPDINRLAQTILVSLPDQWNVYVDLVESVFELEALGTLNTSLDIISNVDLLFKYLRTIQSSDIRSRGPFLAEMEVQLRMIQREPTRPELMTGLQTLLYHYFDTFSSRGCCFSDMRPYLEHLSQQEADILIPALKLLSLVPPQETFIPMGAVTRLVSCYQVLRFCEATRPISMDEHVDLLVSQFNLCQGAVLDVAPTESRPPDMFMVMAAHQLWSEWRNTGQDRWFLKAITLLEFALQFSPNNFHIRLVLIKLYNEAGAVGCAFNAYNGLELKHIQLDSMGYLIIRALQICGHFESTFSLVGSTLRFFNSNQKDVMSNSNPILKPRVPLNVLWIIFDDLRPALGVLGDPIALTPHLDQLGEKSTVFTEAFCQYPLCGPSRISVLTSRRPDTLLSYFNGYPINQTGTFVTFPQYFKEHGVVTASFGKVFHVEDDILFDWDRVWSSKPWFPSQNHSSVESECSRAQGQAQFKLMCPVDLSTHPSAFFADNELVRKVSEFFRNWAETARSNRDQSFFAAVGMHLPHVPFKFPEPYLSAYPLERVKPMPDVENVDFSPEIRQYTRRLFRKWNFLGKNLDPSRFNDRFRHQFKQHYYAAVSFVDRQIGTLLKSLVAAGLDENTIICLTSDHGFALGEHGLIGKQYIYDVTTRVPWMIRHPSASGSLRNFSIVPLEQLHRVASQTRRRPLKSVAQPVESLDIFPTLADLAGIPAPPRCPVFNGMLSRKQPLCVEGTSQAQEVLDHSYPNPRVTNRSLRVAYSLTTQGQLMGRQKRNISMIIILKPETIKTDFQDDQNFLRLRSLCLRVCVALIYLSEDIHPAREILGEEPSNLKVNHPNDTSTNAKPSQVKAEKLSALVRSLIAQIESVLESLQIEGPAPVFLTGPCPTRLHQYVLQGHPQTFVRMVKAVLSVQAFILARPGNTQHGSHNLLEDESPLIRALAVFRDEFEPMVARTLKDFPDFAVRCLNRRLHLENLYNVIESGNFCCLLWGVCHSLLIPVLKGGSGTSGKRSKKKKEQQQPKSPLSSASIDEANVGENYRHQFNTTQQSLVEAMSSLTTFTHGLRPTNHKAAAAEVEAAAVATSAAASLASSTEQLAENLEKLSLANKEAMKNGSSSIEGTTFEEEETQAGEFNTSHGSTRPADEPLQYQTLRELPLDLCQRIEDSYEVSFSQFAGLLERKVSYLRALTL
eukprot:TCALIF_05446-PA protein Name:"Similar to NAA25 N-alpha-acetyltransferase 25, NatB auxiliary subunit (Homo sapiens)" AED:0.06 eAED:0.06 QI:638/0.81/0.83/1/1/1/12/101/1433